MNTLIIFGDYIDEFCKPENFFKTWEVRDDMYISIALYEKLAVDNPALYKKKHIIR